jgi:hypothetical protein
MYFLFSLWLSLISESALADCPTGYAFVKNREIEVQLGAPTTAKGCRLKKADLRDQPLPVTGCFPRSPDPQYIYVETPQGFSDPCFLQSPSGIYIRSSDVTINANKSRDCVECNRKKEATNAYDNRNFALGLLLNDLAAKENKLKPFDKVEKYHRCLLNNKREQGNAGKYEERYRHLIETARESFGVPVGLLTCLCGRESRFNATEQNKESSAKGICQAMSGSLADVERWRSSIPTLKTYWKSFVNRLGKQLEDPSCMGQPLSHEILMRCPSLGIGVAAIYLNYVYSNVERSKTFADINWESQSLNTLTSVAGSYFLGPGTAMRAFKKTSNRSEWPQALARQVCEDSNTAKVKLTPKQLEERLATLQNHMAAIRNCMQNDNWLDHQGKPMGGECAMSPEQIANNTQDMNRFRASLPRKCD